MNGFFHRRRTMSIEKHPTMIFSRWEYTLHLKSIIVNVLRTKETFHTIFQLTFMP